MTKKQGLSPKKNMMDELLCQHDMSHSGKNETKSKWEGEVKASLKPKLEASAEKEKSQRKPNQQSGTYPKEEPDG